MSDPLAGVIRPRLAVQGARPEQVFGAPAQEAAAPAEVAVVAALLRFRREQRVGRELLFGDSSDLAPHGQSLDQCHSVSLTSHLDGGSASLRESGRERGKVDGRRVGHPHLRAPGRKPVRGRMDSPRLLSTHDGVREDLGVKPGRHYQVVHGGAAAVQLPEGSPAPVGDGNLKPRPSVDRDDGNGVLIEPALLSPFRHDRALVIDRRERVEGVAMLLVVSPLHFLRASLKLDEPVLGNGEPPRSRSGFGQPAPHAGGCDAGVVRDRGHVYRSARRRAVAVQQHGGESLSGPAGAARRTNHLGGGAHSGVPMPKSSMVTKSQPSTYLSSKNCRIQSRRPLSPPSS